MKTSTLLYSLALAGIPFFAQAEGKAAPIELPPIYITASALPDDAGDKAVQDNAAVDPAAAAATPQDDR